MTGNVIIGQSGGPSSVINASLAGVFKASKDNGLTVYGMLHGIQGLLEERYVDLSTQIKNELDLELLKRTPSAFLGSCRYKLPNVEDKPEVYEKLFSILKKLNISYFFYNGGNDSMDTTKKLAAYGEKIGSPIRFIGVPKTIDNDLAVTDHTPGFGSAAKYIGATVKELVRDGLVYDQKMVTVIEVMGRNAGWLTAAAALAKSEDNPGPDMIFLPENVFDTDTFIDKIETAQKTKKAICVAVSEGVKTKSGKYLFEQDEDFVTTTDAFGHKQLGGTADYLTQMIMREIGCKTRTVELSSLQRCAAHFASLTDVDEAFSVGAAAVKAAMDGHTGCMIILKRVNDEPYHCVTDMYDVSKIANVEKTIPLDWIDLKNNTVTEDFVKYATPLIFGEIAPVIVNGMPRHLQLSL